MLGVMIDSSRNGVMTVEALKTFIDLLAKMGYDTLMLYTEDTYEVEGEPYFGYMRGRYTKAEMKELDMYCAKQGMELIPCIQTLAHLNGIFQATNRYTEIRDCDDILLIDHERTYELLEHIFRTLRECYTTKKIHIGMDEADKVGLGKYLKKHGYEERFELVNRHVHRVCEMAKRYGFEPMLWSDMFCRLAAESEDYYEGSNLEAVKEKSPLPENATMVYWDYYSSDYERYAKMIKGHQVFGRPVVFAGGAWSWKGFVADNTFAIQNTRVALEACKDLGIRDMLMTLWGDDGAECSRFTSLPVLLFTAETVHGNDDMDSIKQKFWNLTGTDWDAVIELDKLDSVGGRHGFNPSKYLLYNDPFMGLNDYRIAIGDGIYYQELTEKLRNTSVSLPFCDIFETAEKLCELLSVKVDLGVRTREAYLANDKAKLTELAVHDYETAIRCAENFYKAFAKQWAKENKPFGFDIQDIRIGGLIWRMKSCRQRLIAYAEGTITNIPELETEILEGDENVHWTNIATPNVVSHLIFA